MPEILFANFWAGLGVWILLYISDYTLTLICARLYQGGVNQKIAFEGSYELTPYFQGDINALRVVSPRFILALILTSSLMFGVWHVAWQVTPEIYAFALGALVLIQLSIHTRHFRNLFLFRAAATEAVRGRIEYDRQLSLRASAVELLTFCGLFVMLFAFTKSWFILGGAASCLSVAAKHWQLARKHVSDAALSAEKAASATSG